MESRREHLIATSEKMKPIHAGQPLLEWRGYTKDHNPQLKKEFLPRHWTNMRLVHGTIGGDRINYSGDVVARTADIENFWR